jgi:hypothetical protein
MSANDNPEFQRLVSLYETNSGNFQKAFGLTIGFGLFIALTVLLPYYLNIYEYDQNRSLIAHEDETIRQNNLTNSRLIPSAQNLKAYIGNLNDSIHNMKLSMDTQIKQVNSSLSTADKIRANINDPAFNEKMATILSKAKYKENRTIEFFKVFNAKFENSLKTYNERLTNKTQKFKTIENQIETSSSNIKEAQKTIYALNGELMNLTHQWKEIQTPFGNLPIDFTNLLAIFPIAVTSGYVLCAIWLKESIRLRSFIHAMHKSDKVYEFAPLWVEPKKKGGILFLQFLLFFVPVLIALLSVLMIVFAWEHAPTPPFPSGSEVNKVIYYAVYGICFGLFGFSFGSVVHQVWKYDDSQKTWNPGKDWG